MAARSLARARVILDSTAFSESDTPRGWRETRATSGCLIDVPGGRTVARGFAMPHSPRVHRGRVWMLDSGTGRLVRVEPASGRAETVAELPGSELLDAQLE